MHFRTTSRELFRGGKIVPIGPQRYMLLEVLIQRRPAVVTNVELDEILWPDVYVERSSSATMGFRKSDPSPQTERRLDL
jgi:DNA-binding winged helix-turn-helix (wHTH) protein